MAFDLASHVVRAVQGKARVLGTSAVMEMLASARCVFSPVAKGGKTHTIDGVYDAREDVLRCICPAEDAFELPTNSSDLRWTLQFGRLDGILHTFPIGLLQWFDPSTVFPVPAIPTRLEHTRRQSRSFRAVQYWPSSGPRQGGTVVQVGFEGGSAATNVECHFGSVVVPATNLNECISPSFVESMVSVRQPARYVDVIDFAVSAQIDGVIQKAEGGQFLFVSPPVLLSMTPMFGVSSGGSQLSLHGQNLSNHCSNFYVAFTSSSNATALSLRRPIDNAAVTIGVLDATNGEIVARVPRLPSGVYSVAISVDDGVSFSFVAGRYISMHDTRVAIVPGATSLQFDILYSAFAVRADGDQQVISAVLCHAPLLWKSARPMSRVLHQHVVDRNPTTMFEWKLGLSTYEVEALLQAGGAAGDPGSTSFAPHYSLLLSMFEIQYRDSLPDIPASKDQYRLHERLSIFDDNSGVGWVFLGTQRHPDELPGEGNVVDWHALNPVGLQAGLVLWTSTQQNVSVVFSRDPLTFPTDEFMTRSTVSANHTHFDTARFDAFNGVVAVDLPQVHEDLMDGTVVPVMTKDSSLRFLSVSIDGGASFSECYGSICGFAFDKRYDIAFDVERIVFRVVPAALMLVNQTLAFNLVSRWFTEERISFDVAASLGIARDRVVISFLDAKTGVVQVDLLASGLPADPSPADLVETLKTHIQDTTSPLYDGITTWATDPLFIDGGKVVVDDGGEMFTVGRCSQSEYLTKKACLSFGVCRCTGITDRESCLQKKDAGNYPCSWTSFLTWNASARVRM